jgi:rhamnosyltransferase
VARTDPAAGPLVSHANDAQHSRPRILVLLAARNGAPWISAQLRSILDQRDVDVHVIVRDDASTDETRAQIAPFLDDHRVKLTYADTPSGSAAHNFFTLMSENPPAGFNLVALADQDDEWYADKLARASRQLMASSSDGYSSATLAVWPDGKSAVLTQSSRPTPSDFLFGGIGQGCTFVLTAGFYGRARDFLAHNARLTQEVHYHDWALYALARSWRLAWTFDPVPSVRYRQHDGNDTGARTGLRGARKRLKLIRDDWYTSQLRAIAALCVAANPSDPHLSGWRALVTAPRSWSRRVRIARLCLHGGRRSVADNCVVVFAALAGWL